MAKATLTLNDTFTFSFSKNTVGSQDSIREIPNFVFDEFIRSLNVGTALYNEYYAELGLKRLDAGFDTATLPKYLLEVTFLFEGVKIGGISYAPKYKSDSTVIVEYIQIEKEDAENFYISARVEGSLVWDYKTNELAKHRSTVEKCGSTWEEAKVSVRLNFRDNFILTNHFLYDATGKRLPNPPYEILNGKKIGHPEDATNLAFVLAMTPNVLAVLRNEEISAERKDKYPYLHALSGKKVVLNSKDLKIG